jgi:hypothetical protein
LVIAASGWLSSCASVDDQLGLKIGDLRGGVLARADVADEAEEQDLLEASGQHHRELDRDFDAVLLDRHRLDLAAEDADLAGAQEPLDAGVVRGAQPLGNDQAAELLSGRFGRRPAEHALGDLVPGRDAAVGPHDDDRVERGVEHRGEQLSSGLRRLRHRGGLHRIRRHCTARISTERLAESCCMPPRKSSGRPVRRIPLGTLPQYLGIHSRK